MWRSFKLKIAIGILALLALFVVLLHTAPLRRYALKQAIEILAREGVDFDASQIDYNLLDLTATLGHVTVRSRQTPDLPPLAKVDRIHVELSLRKLLHGAFYVQDAEIVNPALHLVVDEKGRDNLPHSPASQSSSETDYLVEKLRLTGGSLHFEERRQQIDTTLPLWQIAIDSNQVTKDQVIRLETGQPGRISFQQRSLPIQSLTTEVVLQKNAADIRGLKLVLGESTIAFSGRLDNFKDPAYDVKAETDLALGSLTQLAGVPQKIGGTVHASLTATGPLARMRATARLDGKDLTVERFSKLALKAESTYDAGAQRIQLESFNLLSPAGAIQGKGSVALNTNAGDSTLNAAVRGLDLAQLSTALKLPVRIASRANGQVEAHWPALDFGKAAGDASMKLAATQQAPAKDIIPVSGSVTAKSAGNRVVVGISSLDAMNAHATGQITLVDQRALGGELKLEAPDLAGAVAGAERLLGRTLIDTKIGGAISADAKLGGTLQNPTAAVTLGSNNLQAGTLTGISLNAAVNYTPAELVIQDALVEWQNQQITASGTVGLKGAAAPIALQARTSTLSIPTLLAAAGRQDIPATGSLSLEANVGGTAKNPQAHVNVNASDLAAYNETIGALAAEADLAGQVVTVSRLHLDKPQAGGDGTVDATGSYNLESKDYKIDLASKGIRLTSLTLPDGSPLRAALNLQAQGQGNLDNPAGAVKLSADDIQYRDQQFGAVNLSANLANQQADLEAAAPKFNLTAKANVGVKEPNPVKFEVTANNTDLASLPVKLEQPVAGTISGTVRGSGDLKNYEQGQATAEIAKLNLTYNGQPIQTEGPLIAGYQNKVLTIERATILARDSRLSIDGKLPLDAAAGSGAINLDGTVNLETLRAYLPVEQPLVAVGTATVKGTVTGTLKDIDPNLSLSLDKGFVSGAGVDPPLANLTLRAQIRNGALELEKLTGDWGPATFQASGQVPFGLLPADLPVNLPRRQGPAQFTAEMNEIDLAAFSGAPKDMTGAVSVKLEAQAPRPELDAVTAKLTFPTLRAGLGSYNLQQSAPSTITVANGVARIEQLQFTGPDTDIRLTGTAGLTGARPLDLHLDGKLDAAIAGAFTEAVRARGATELALSVTGTAQDPQAQGHVQLSDAQVSLQNPRIGIDGLNTRIDLAGTRATISQLTGTMNGGALSGGGSLEYAEGQLRNTNLNIKADGVYLDYPEGLKTVSNIDLSLRNDAENLVVGGNVVLLEGGFTDNLSIDQGILAAVTSPRGLEVTEDRSPLLQKVRFNVGVRTGNPLYVKNNMAKAEIDADLKLLGDPYEMGLSGRLTIVEGSELTFNERKYTVDRGNIMFTNERRIEPNLDIQATTTAGGYNITLQVTGTPGKTETTLTADPPGLSDQDILAVLLTGKKLDEIRGKEFEVARNEMLSYLTGRVGSSLGSKVAGATGLSSVRIEPNLIANETNPSARLTIGQDITSKLNLIYSMDLINSSDQIYVGEYDISRRFSTRGIRQSDGSFRGDFRHDLLFGGLPDPKRAAKVENRRIEKITIQGITYFPEDKIQSKLKVKTGQKYDFFKVRKGVDRVDKMYVKENLLEASVRLKREMTGQNVDLTLQVDAGPKVDFVFEGVNADGGLKKRVRDIWHSGVFDSQRAEESMQAIRAWLVKQGNLRPKIEYRINKPSPDHESVVFDIQPGSKFVDVKIDFAGAEGIDPKTLREIIADQKLSQDVYVKPGRVTELLTRYYQEQGYLEAKIDTPRYELNEETRTGKVVFPVDEGSLYKIARVEFQGNTVFGAERLAEEAPLTQAGEYRPVLREQTMQKIRDLYWGVGYNDVEVNVTTRRHKEAGELDAIVNITEGLQSIAREIVVEGADKTSENMIRTQLEVKPGEVLNLQKLANSRRNLYNTGAYSLIEISREDIAPDATGGSADRPEMTKLQKPVRLTVKVREVQPFELRYGGFYDTERGPGVIADFTNRNSLGSARSLGLRTRYDSQLKEARLYFTQPLLRRFPVSTTASPYIRRENNPATSTADAFNVDRVGFSIQQEAKFRGAYVLNYGYRIEKTRTYDAGPDPIFDIPLRIASLTSTLTRETRDEVLDASRGQFISQAFQFSPQLLGSQLRFIKYFGQYFRYFPLQKPKVQLFTNQVLRPRLVFATGVRVGLAKGLGGQEIPLSERFFAGGSTTIRGFEQNGVGEVGPGRLPLGGDAMLVINNELRFPLISRFDGVAFVDIGNVYPHISDFSLTDIRKAAGLGLRLRTPWFLLRLDYGMKLDRRQGESAGRLFFSIGQAF